MNTARSKKGSPRDWLAILIFTSSILGYMRASQSATEGLINFSMLWLLDHI